MKHHVWTGAFLISALAFYAAGMGGGGTLLLVLGLACECGFWIRLLQARRRQSLDTPTSRG